MKRMSLFGITALTLATMGDVTAAYAADCELSPAASDGPFKGSVTVEISHDDAKSFLVRRHVCGGTGPSCARTVNVPVQRSATCDAYVRLTQDSVLDVAGFDADGDPVCSTTTDEYKVFGSGGGKPKATGGAAAASATAAPPAPTAGKLGTKTVINDDGTVSVHATVTNVRCDTVLTCDASGNNCKCPDGHSTETAYDITGADRGLANRIDGVDHRVDGLEGRMNALPRPPTEAEQETRVSVGADAVGNLRYGSGVAGVASVRANLADALPYLLVRGELGALDLGGDNRFFGGGALGPSFQLDQHDDLEIAALVGFNLDDRDEILGARVYGEGLLRWYPADHVELHGGMAIGSSRIEAIDATGDVEPEWGFDIGARGGAALHF